MYVVVVVVMEEGWHMISNIIDCTVGEVRIGMRVRVKFVEYEGIHLPFVVPDTSVVATQVAAQAV
jgi:uncharacterized protein